MTGIVTITLVLNASTAKWLLSYLQLTEESRSTDDENVKIYELTQYRFTSRMRKAARRIAEGYQCDEHEIEQYCSLLGDERLSRTSIQYKNDVRHDLLRMSISPRERSSTSATDTGSLSSYLLRFLRQQFYTTLKAQYNEYIISGRIERQSYTAHTLDNAVDRALDYLSDPVELFVLFYSLWYNNCSLL